MPHPPRRGQVVPPTCARAFANRCQSLTGVDGRRRNKLNPWLRFNFLRFLPFSLQGPAGQHLVLALTNERDATCANPEGNSRLVEASSACRCGLCAVMGNKFIGSHEPIMSPLFLVVKRPLIGAGTDTRATLEYMGTLGRRIRDLRKARGLNQQQLAKAAGLHQSAISLLERNVTKTGTGPTILALSAALDVSPEWLSTGQGSPLRGVSPSVDESELLEIFKRLPEAQRLEWLRFGRFLLSQLPASVANPFPA